MRVGKASSVEASISSQSRVSGWTWLSSRYSLSIHESTKGIPEEDGVTLNYSCTTQGITWTAFLVKSEPLMRKPSPSQLATGGSLWTSLGASRDPGVANGVAEHLKSSS